jgi:hypothetical protein
VAIEKEDTLFLDDAMKKFGWGLTGLLYSVESIP